MENLSRLSENLDACSANGNSSANGINGLSGAINNSAEAHMLQDTSKSWNIEVVIISYFGIKLIRHLNND